MDCARGGNAGSVLAAGINAALQIIVRHIDTAGARPPRQRRPASCANSDGGDADGLAVHDQSMPRTRPAPSSQAGRALAELEELAICQARRGCPQPQAGTVRRICHSNLCLCGQAGGRGWYGPTGGDAASKTNEGEGFHQMRLRLGSSGRVGTLFQFHQPW